MRSMTICGAALLLCGGSLALGSDPAGDRITFTGAEAAGVTSVSFQGGVYSLRFAGDEVLEYRVDLNDPLVAGGQLRVHEHKSDSYPIDGGGFIYRDPNGDADPGNDLYWFPWHLVDKTTLVSHGATGSTVTLDYRLDFNGEHPIRYELSLEQKVLRIRVVDPTGNLAVSNNFSGVWYGRASGVEQPKTIRMQGQLAPILTLFHDGPQRYFTTSFVDMFQSNAADYGNPDTFALDEGADWVYGGYNTILQYKPLSNGKLAAALDDQFVLVVSRFVKDALITSTAAPSPYRALMMNRMVFDGPEKVWSYYSDAFDFYRDLGLYNLAGYFFEWSAGAADPPLPYNAGPDWAPAVSDAAFAAMMAKGAAYGHVLGAYSAFNSLPPTAPTAVTDPAEIVRDAGGQPKLFNDVGFPLLGMEAMAGHADREAAALKQRNGTAVYLDIHTYGSLSKGPDGDHIDQQAGSPWAKTMREAFVVQKEWMERMRDELEGPLLGEGSIATQNTNMEFLWFGYADSIQRCINTGSGKGADELPVGSPVAPTAWPIIPEYEWRVAARKQVNHGNGFYDRFFGPSDGPSVVDMNTGLPLQPLTQDARDLYNAYAITYGHAGFLITNGLQSPVGSYITRAGVVDTYFMTNALQTLFYLFPVVGIHYLHQGSYKTFEQVLFSTGTTDSFRQIPIVISFQGGLRIHVNHGTSPLAVTDGGVTYTLPPKTGWYAAMPGVLKCFSAIAPGTGGNRIDYCFAAGQYEYFNGRGNVGGYGAIATPHNKIAYHVTPTNLSVVEEGSGAFQRTQGPIPAVVSIDSYPGSVSLSAGDRAGLKAVALFANSGIYDASTLVDWQSTDEAVVTVNRAGVITAEGPGQAFVVGLGLGPFVAVTSVTVSS